MATTEIAQPAAAVEATRRSPTSTALWTVLGVVVVVGLAVLTKLFEKRVPGWLAGTELSSVAKSIEFPVYAIALGLLGNLILTLLRLRDRLALAFRTDLEFRARALREAGWRPIVVFGSATVVNIGLALGLATLLFANFTL